MQRRVKPLAVIAFALFAAPATGQNVADKWKQCQDTTYRNADDRIASCTAIIESGQQSPNNLALAYGNRGSAYSDKGQYDLAIADYSRYLQTIPNAAGYYNRARVHNIKHNFDEAIADATRAIELNDPKALSLRCSAYAGKASDDEKKDDVRAALADYKNAIVDCRKAPFDPLGAMAQALSRAGLLRLAEKQIDKGDYKQAIAILDDTRQLMPDDPSVYHQRGRAYKYGGEPARANDDFDQAIKLLEARTPKAQYDHFNEGEVYASRGDYGRAEAALGASLGMKPDDFVALVARCRARTALGRLEQALDDCNAAIARSNVAAVGMRGTLYLKMKNYEAALTDFNAVLEKDAKAAVALYGRGLVKAVRGDTAGAKEDTERAQKLNAHIAADFDSWGLQRESFEAGGVWKTVESIAQAVVDRVRSTFTYFSSTDERPAPDVKQRPPEAAKTDPKDVALGPAAPSAPAPVTKPDPAPAEVEADGVAAYERRDYAAALRIFRPLADKGSASAQYHLAMLYDDGNAVAQDPTEAVRWYRKAAEQADPRAQYRLGQHYATGKGVEKDLDKARIWYGWAAARRHPDAEFRLGMLLILGNAEDKTRAKELFRDAAEQGQVSAQMLMGNFARDARQNEEALRWWRKAAANGSTEAKKRLGMP
ncbi:SEL1-like repeat protein [Bradyrhizobium diazoefficiens]|nr:sel1 repeat family protein [Bradyrhizobium diazoefficiens]MBR0777577.1 SEL1-like repeat protein [Bradyrhizobium diazoefficiens]